MQGGTVIAAGMRLEVPAPGHHTVMQGESWADLALSWLGTNDMARTELLAHANKGVPWVPPVEGQEIEIPAVMTYLAGDGRDGQLASPQRFWGDPNRGWELNTYNRREGVTVHRGEVVLVPMPGLRLTEAGRAEARAAAERDGRQRRDGARAAATRPTPSCPSSSRTSATGATPRPSRAATASSAAARSPTRSWRSSTARCSRPTSPSTPSASAAGSLRGVEVERAQPRARSRPRLAEDTRRVRRAVN